MAGEAVARYVGYVPGCGVGHARPHDAGLDVGPLSTCGWRRFHGNTHTISYKQTSDAKGQHGAYEYIVGEV